MVCVTISMAKGAFVSYGKRKPYRYRWNHRGARD